MQDPQGTRDESRARPLARWSLPWANLALVLASLLLSLVLLEIGFRAVAGLPVFKFADWRTHRLLPGQFRDRVVADPVVGWTNVPWTRSDDSESNFETIDYGIRRNFDETTVRTGGMLAVGDSFTQGVEVDRNESWPAALEGMTGVPIVNAGVAGYGTDQIIMRAEQLLPIVKPKILIIGFFDDDILRAGRSLHDGAPKPYFTIENGELRYHPPPRLQPPKQESLMSSIGYRLRDGLGYFATADYVLARLTPGYWYGTESERYQRRPEVNEVAVTCALLRRVKAQADKDDIRTILFMQYYAYDILEASKPPRHAQRVIACAQAAGIRVADQFMSLRDIAVRRRSAMKEYYIYRPIDRGYGHMSAKGNRHAGHMLSQALRDWLEALPRTHEAGAQPPTGERP